MILNFIHWGVKPDLLSIGGLHIRWYGLLFAAGFYVGYLVMTKFFKKEEVPIPLLDKLAMYMILATVIGARLGHCLFYEPSYYLKNPIKILYIWEGGLASHGAAIAIITALYFYFRQTKLNFFWVIDRISIVVALAGTFIRTGNLMNSEIYGKQTDLPWAFVFTSEDNIPRHPTQIYEAVSYLAIFFLLRWYYYKHDGKPNNGMIFGMFLTLLFSARFLLEFFKENQVKFEDTLTLNMGQLLSLPFIAGGLILIALALRNRLQFDNKK